ncbi:hypothetical protein Sjap_014287 [Stephania japonica]|uniref:Plant heme peroxidase family profile domain-containing protein n=1 Tax=Stephania japonica TaxID=461633 RepID=A0AAP0J0C5_9MAGN
MASSLSFLSRALLLVLLMGVSPSVQLSSDDFYEPICSGGCDGSILLDDNGNCKGEQSATPNANSIRGLDVVDDIKTKLEARCPGVVSCADILAVAARDSVLDLGRRDSLTASLSLANSDIPLPSLDLNGLVTAFTDRGLDARELVALLGTS